MRINMNIKKIAIVWLSVFIMLSTTGCGDALYTLTNGEEETIVLYAAKTVGKFNRNRGIGLCNVTVRPGELEKQDDSNNTSDDNKVLENLNNALDELSGNTNTANTENNSPTSSTQNNQSSGNETSDDRTQTGLSLSEVLDVPGIEFSLNDFTVNNTFSAGNYFVLTARNGYSYLAVNIKAKNTTSSAVNIDMLSRNSKYYLTVNNAYKQMSQTTILLNDLSTYKGSIAPGESKDMVILFMFPTTQVGDIQSVGFSVETDGNRRSVSF